MRITSLFITFLIITACCHAPEPFGAIPRPSQIEWQKMETNMFIHFGPNTFTSAEWGDGTEDADVFAPGMLDCRQWAATAKASGMKGIIITAKHHDGFCLWPNPESRHTVAQSSWRGGKGDVLKELSEACREYGLKFGIYISPWDRNDPHYGSDEYNEVFRKTLEHAHTHYGDIFEQWFDGACGEGPNGKKQVYKWDIFNGEVFKHHPEAVIFSDIGPGCRWIGNERGIAGETCWSTLDIEGFSPGSNPPGRGVLNTGLMNGGAWVPGEADVSIRPGWFWKESENDDVKSLDHLLHIYYSSVGHNSLLLLNVPPDTRGLIHSIDSTRLMEFRQALDKIFSHDLAKDATIEASSERGYRFRASKLSDNDYDSFWCPEDKDENISLTLSFDTPRTFNRIQLQEYIALGQRVSGFNIEAMDSEGSWHTVAEATTIGYKRIVLTDMLTTQKLRINITSALAVPVLNSISIFRDDIYKGYGAVDTEGEIFWNKSSKPIIWNGEKCSEIKGFRYTPASGNDCIIRYRLEKTTDGITWESIFENKMFDNIVNNPTAQTVMFEQPVNALSIRLTPTECVMDDRYAFVDFSAI